jgi:hypothetical protein
VLTFEITSNNDFVSPFIDPDVSRMHFEKYIINNDYTNEHTSYGNAFAKHVTTKISFGEGRLAEDLLVYLTAYKPLGTDLKVYGRIHNATDPEAFDDKDWTLLEQKTAVGVYSSLYNPADYIEFSYGLTQSPNTQYTCNGTVTGTVYNNEFTGSGTLFDAEVVADDLLKIYDPLFPTNYFVAVVNNVVSDTSLFTKSILGDISDYGPGTVSVTSAANTVAGTNTSFLDIFEPGDYIAVYDTSTFDVRKIYTVNNKNTIQSETNFSFSNATARYAKVQISPETNLTVSGWKVDKLEFKNQAFNYRPNDNVARYHSETLSQYDGFSSFQLKVVLLSNNEYVAPKVDDIRAIAVSA